MNLFCHMCFGKKCSCWMDYVDWRHVSNERSATLLCNLVSPCTVCTLSSSLSRCLGVFVLFLLCLSFAILSLPSSRSPYWRGGHEAQVSSATLQVPQRPPGSILHTSLQSSYSCVILIVHFTMLVYCVHRKSTGGLSIIPKIQYNVSLDHKPICPTAQNKSPLLQRPVVPKIHTPWSFLPYIVFLDRKDKVRWPS